MSFRWNGEHNYDHGGLSDGEVREQAQRQEELR